MFELRRIKGDINSVSGFFCDGIFGDLKGKYTKEEVDKINADLLNLDPKSSKEVLLPIKPDIGYIYCKDGFIAHTFFTTNSFQAAPIKHFLNNKHKKSNFILVNTTNANALTGPSGLDDIDLMLASLNKKFSFLQNPISSSTGVIGKRLPLDKIISSFKYLEHGLNNFQSKDFNSLKNSALRFNQAILTTDRFTKSIAFEVSFEDFKFSIACSVKGAGMINPSMATMLCFIATSLDTSFLDMDEILKECIHSSFNAISVDGDMSTNDSVFFLSSSKVKIKEELKEGFKDVFTKILKQMLLDMALKIASDGEGATKLVAFRVQNASSKKDAFRLAKALSNSLLLKTALFGCDPNWGRIASTIGASKVEAYEDRLLIKLDDVILYNKGLDCLDEASLAKALKIMQKDEYKITCDLNVGEHSYEAYGCDLGHQYVEINSSYSS